MTMPAMHRRKREVDAHKHLRRLHKIVPFIESPLQGADHEHLVFSQRHEANTLELFFDLFFVANLATFTTYHAVIDSTSLWGYVGFFFILWGTWFQVTLHDVRFARDSTYERICKIIHFIGFVGLALVGSSFQPNGKRSETDKGPNSNFRVLCYVLLITRVLLAIQYTVVLIFTMKAGFKRLYLPLGVNIAVYIAAAIVFGAMTPAFRDNKGEPKHIYAVWYIVMILETIAVITISCNWRMLSFKKTHLVERMGLLTLIVIGEGAIGASKTVSKMMGKSGLDVEGCFLIMCIILVLVFLWALYFDNAARGHFGTIKQQIWSVLHFPLHLSIVGLVEGSQQVSLARYALKAWGKLDKAATQACFKDKLNGQQLVSKLNDTVTYFALKKKPETLYYVPKVTADFKAIGNVTNLCPGDSTDALPDQIFKLNYDTWAGVLTGLGIRFPTTKDPVEAALHSWYVVYMYYWGCFVILMLCSVVFLILIRRHKIDIFDFVSLTIRALAIVVGCILLALWTKPITMGNLIDSPALLPILVILLFLVLLFDRGSAMFANWRLKKSGQPYALEEEEEHHGGHGHGHESDGKHHEDKWRSSGATSVHTGERDPLTQNTAYHGNNQFQMQPMNPNAHQGYASGGYTSVTNTHGGHQGHHYA